MCELLGPLQMCRAKYAGDACPARCYSFANAGGCCLERLPREAKMASRSWLGSCALFHVAT